MKARYFNSIIKNGNIITKSSTDIYKIKKEFKYYYLLPEDLKKFFVKPFNYRETEDQAKYDMEYSGITLYEFLYDLKAKDLDIAVNKIIEQLNEYFEIRNKYTKIVFNKDFVYDKVILRIDKLKKLEEYNKINNFLNSVDVNLDELVEKFKKEYKELPIKEKILTISHGDLHFSNILINEETYKIKFIDTRGALNEDDLYIDNEYDLAKLLHSVEGLYDYVINDNYQIELNDKMIDYKFNVYMKNKETVEAYKKIFNSIYSNLPHTKFEIIRIYTASLFLSMLPLHKDSIKRILAFINISRRFLNNDLMFE